MLVTHKPFHEKRIEVFQSKNAQIHLKRRAYFQVDGEYLGKRTSIQARILPRILYVMLPEQKALA